MSSLITPIYVSNTAGTAINGETTAGTALWGAATSTGIGVKGTSTGSVGVYGQSSSDDGIFGTTNNATHAGVYGTNTSGNSNGFGVEGQSSNGSGVHGDSTNGYGVTGISNSSYGVYGQSTGSRGVVGDSTDGFGVLGQSVNSVGVYGYTANPSTSWAGYFQGDINVTGNCIGCLGSSKIDDPLDPANKYLLHSAVQSPDMMDVYNGNITTDDKGEATVQMPDYFEALNRDFRYQLTVMGQFAQAIVGQEIKDGKFVIKTDKPNVKVSWQVTGIRQDAYNNAHRIPVEEEKPADEKGKYLHPTELGQPASSGIGYEEQQKMLQAAQSRP